MRRLVKIKYRTFKKEVSKFWELIETQPLRLGFLSLAGLFFLSLPGQNFYQTLKISAGRLLVREVNFPVPTVFPYPVKISSNPPPEITAHSAVVMDVDSKVVIFAKEPHLKLSPASLTKIVTALVALKNYQLDDILTVSNLYPEGAQMGLFKDEQISVENLLYGLLLPSGNDAAFTLAENFPGGFEQFIVSMNEEVDQLGLKATHFANPTGEENGNHFSTTWDMAHLASYVVQNPVFARIVSTKNINLSSSDQTKWHELKSTNILLGEDLGVKGVKTGWTEESGGCFIAYVERDGQKVVIVVFKSEDEYTRFDDARALINWTFANHEWQKLEVPTHGVEDPRP